MEAAVKPNAGINFFAKTSAVIAEIEKRKEEAVELVSESGDVGAFTAQSDYKQLAEDVSLGQMLTAEEIQNIQTYSKRKIMAKDILLTVDYAYDILCRVRCLKDSCLQRISYTISKTTK